MIKHILQTGKGCFSIITLSILLFSCSKKELVDFDYPDSIIYMPQAYIANGTAGIYNISPRIEGQLYRYATDVAANKFNVPLGVIRSGVDLSGTVTVSVTPVTDTVTKMIAAGRFAVATDPAVVTEVLPSSAFTLPSTISVENGSSSQSFDLGINLDFLRNSLINTPKKRYAIGTFIAAPESDKVVNRNLSTTVILIDPQQVLVPVSNFTSSVARETRTASFVNLSANGVSYSWNFGDNTPVSTEVSPNHTYAAGSYTVTLTTTGIPGVSATSVRTATIVVQ